MDAMQEKCIKKFNIGLEQLKSSGESYEFDDEYDGDGMYTITRLKFAVIDIAESKKWDALSISKKHFKSNYTVYDGKFFDNVFDLELLWDDDDDGWEGFKKAIIETEQRHYFTRRYDEKVEEEEEFIEIVEFIE